MSESSHAPHVPSMVDTETPLRHLHPIPDEDLEKRAIRNRLRAELFGSSAELRVGRFALLERIGAGAMGVVHAGYDDTLDRKVAIKLISPRVASSERARVRMVREAQALAKVNHPNVVQIYEAGMHEGHLFIAMEFVQGQTLWTWAGTGDERRPWHEVIEAYLQAGRGLAAAHRAGLVHRDFKPDNAMIDEQGVVRVMDFGLARTGVELELGTTADGRPSPTHEPFSEALTHTGALIGTPAYMAPEQFEGRDADARSDQFSFCVCLWEALHGRRPFGGATVEELANAVTRGDLRPADGPVPAAVTKVLERGLRLDPGERWDSLEALLGALAPSAPKRRVALGLGLAALGALAGAAAVVALSLSGTDPARELTGVEDRPSNVEPALSALGTELPPPRPENPTPGAGQATKPYPVAPEFEEVARSIGSPNDGRLEDAVQLPVLPELYMSAKPRLQWGTAYTVEHLVAAIRHFRASTGFSHPIVVAELSLKRGGKFAPHKSHQSGRDVDIRFIAKLGVPLDDLELGMPPARDDIDYFATFQLVRSLAAAPGVKTIFISQDAQKRLGDAAVAQGVATAEVARLFDPTGSDGPRLLHSIGHERALHVRFHCGPNQPACID